MEMVRILTLSLTLRSLTEGIRVLQTNPDLELPPRLAQAELLDSSLSNLDQFTVCMRIKTYQFTTYNEVTASYQAALTSGPIWMFGAYVGLPCDQRYTGCTQAQKDRYKRGSIYLTDLSYTRTVMLQAASLFSSLRLSSSNYLFILLSILCRKDDIPGTERTGSTRR